MGREVLVETKGAQAEDRGGNGMQPGAQTARGGEHEMRPGRTGSP